MMIIQKIVFLYFRGTYMTNVASDSNTSPAKSESAAETKQAKIQPRQGSGAARRRHPAEGPPDLTLALS
jgi:hypothetical protein